MIYYTGDIHGSQYEVTRFCRRMNLTRKDIVVLLGDVGANYFKDDRDRALKQALSKMKCTFLCIHGNHEIRPERIPSYELKEWNGGLVWVEPDYPNLLFAKDGEIYNIKGLYHLVIGGAYSVDKHYRLYRGLQWWSDEQPSAEIKLYVEQQITKPPIDIVLSHTRRSISAYGGSEYRGCQYRALAGYHRRKAGLPCVVLWSLAYQQAHR